jgi:molybdenum cofactor cytidylyltransferase
MSERKTQFILLAAGSSSRMGTDKALLEFHGKTWIEHQALQIQKSECIERLILVDQPGKSFLYDRLMTHVAPLGFQIHLAENKLKESQPFDSIRIGLEAVPRGEGCFISPVDVPLKSKLINQIWKQTDDGRQAVKPSYKHQGGHPIWLGPVAIEKFKDKPQRLDEFLAGLTVDYVDVHDSRIRLNLNTPEEWQAYVTRESHQES